MLADFQELDKLLLVNTYSIYLLHFDLQGVKVQISAIDFDSSGSDDLIDVFRI